MWTFDLTPNFIDAILWTTKYERKNKMAHATQHNKMDKDMFETFGIIFAWVVGLAVASASTFFFLIVAGDLYTGHTPSDSFMAWEFLVIWSIAPLAFLWLIKRRIFG